MNVAGQIYVRCRTIGLKLIPRANHRKVGNSLSFASDPDAITEFEGGSPNAPFVKLFTL
jgi:hypothetical protein